MRRTVRRYRLALWVIESAVVVALLVALLTVPSGARERWLVGIAVACVAVMAGAWLVLVRPLNAMMAAWTEETLPADWTYHHRRWTALHRARATLAIIALALLLTAVFARPAH